MTKNIRRSAKSVAASRVKAMAAAAGGHERPQTKKQIALSLLRRPKGASITEMKEAMGWQPHSVRGPLSGTIRKMPDVVLASEKQGRGPRRYRLEASGV